MKIEVDELQSQLREKQDHIDRLLEYMDLSEDDLKKLLMEKDVISEMESIKNVLNNCVFSRL